MRYFVIVFAVFCFLLPLNVAHAGHLKCSIYYSDFDANNPSTVYGRAHCFNGNNDGSDTVFSQDLGVLNSGNTSSKVRNVMIQIRQSYASQYDLIGIDITSLKTQPQYSGGLSHAFCVHGNDIKVFVRSGNGNFCDLVH